MLIARFYCTYNHISRSLYLTAKLESTQSTPSHRDSTTPLITNSNSYSLPKSILDSRVQWCQSGELLNSMTLGGEVGDAEDKAKNEQNEKNQSDHDERNDREWCYGRDDWNYE